MLRVLSKCFFVSCVGTDRFRSFHTKKFAQAVLGKLEDYNLTVKTSAVKIAACLDPRVTAFLSVIGGDIEALKRLVIDEYTLEYADSYYENLDLKEKNNSQKQGEFMDLLTIR